ncbi:hypothetical protein H9W95_18315 [Flavobacterium lindanitolerans]|nr:hypothetical protein [Flavobacterium lindanitolerans]
MPENQMRTQELLAREGLESIGQKLYNNINIELSGILKVQEGGFGSYCKMPKM